MCFYNIYRCLFLPNGYFADFYLTSFFPHIYKQSITVTVFYLITDNLKRILCVISQLDLLHTRNVKCLHVGDN